MGLPGSPPPLATKPSAAQDAAETITRDTLMRGRVVVFQPERGYRFSLDPVLLAGFVSPPLGRFLDLGAGCGVLGFLLLARDASSTGASVELQERLAELSQRGCIENQFEARLAIHQADFLNWANDEPAASFDLIVSNPPFYEVEGGHLSPNPERALAHHELAMPLERWIAAAARLLKPAGRLAVVFPAERERRLFAVLGQHGLLALRVRRARPSEGKPYHRVLVEAQLGPAALMVEPDLVVHEAGGFAPEVLRYLGERE